jgi:hypothetical protein
MITTGGFKPTVLPVYTPVDPRLVAFRPDMALGGVSQGLSLADLYMKYKADIGEAREREATRPGRIKAANAVSDATAEQALASLPVFSRKAAYDLANYDALTSLVPKRTEAEQIGLQSSIDIAPSKVAAEIAGNKEAARNAPILGAAARAEAEGRILDADTKKLVTPLERATYVQGLADKLANAKTDADRQRAFRDAQTAYYNAQAQKESAQAGYYDRGGAPRGRRTVAQEKKTIVDAMKTIAATPVSDGRSFKVYLDEEYEGGKLKGSTLGFGGGTPDEIGEALMEQYLALADDLKRLNSAPDDAVLGDTSEKTDPGAPQTKPGRMRFVADETGGISLKPID